MEIKYWSDIACPFCYIGSHRMKRALKELGIAETTPFEFKSFELNPYTPKETTETYLNHFMQGNLAMKPQAMQKMAQIEAMAHNDDLAMDIQKVVPTNTFDAHRLIQLAQSKHDPALAQRVIDRFYQVYFNDGQSIADHEVLIKAASEAGLAEDEVRAVLASDQYQQNVRDDETEARQSGIHGAPFFVINNKYGISGAQPYEVFVKALKQVQAEEG